MQKIYKYSNTNLEEAFVRELQANALKGWTVQTIASINNFIIVVYNVPNVIENTDPPY